MKKKILLLVLLGAMQAKAQTTEKFRSFPFGSIKPEGWIKEQMQKDMEGFVGNLDQIVPDLMQDPIYGEGRLQGNSKAKDLGNLKSGDAEGDEQYKWWNSETQSNWWDGYIRNALLVGNAEANEKVKQHIESTLATQDPDGYLGIYAKDLRYQFKSENGELWAKTSLYRGLLAWFEFTGDQRVWQALVSATENVMQNYPIDESSPFESGKGFNGGVSHGLCFIDILERMYFHTGDSKYRDYAYFLYQDFSKTYQSESDAQLESILNPSYRFKSHGVHTYEHFRALLVASYAKDDQQMKEATRTYLKRLEEVTSPSGAAIGDEWIAERKADATHTGYEYCSLHELLDSYCLLLQKSGSAAIADKIEKLFFNAAQGSRHPEHSCIAYLKTDNSYEMMGTKNGEIEADRKQTRYKYSPAHQDVAVCCNPNAGRISPYLIQNAWMKENSETLVAALLVPTRLETNIQGKQIQIENISQYPNKNEVKLRIQLSEATRFTLKIRKPEWALKIRSKESYRLEDGFVLIQREFAQRDSVDLEFIAEVKANTDEQGKHYFSYGALVYAWPIPAKEIPGKKYTNEFRDYFYQPETSKRYSFHPKHKAKFEQGKIKLKLRSMQDGKIEELELIPFGKTILRQLTF